MKACSVCGSFSPVIWAIYVALVAVDDFAFVA